MPEGPAIPGAPMGCNSRSISMHKAAGRRGNRRSRGSRTPESEVGTSTDAPVALSGVLRGWADCERGPALWGRSRTGGTSPKRAFAYFSPVRKVGRPSGRNLRRTRRDETRQTKGLRAPPGKREEFQRQNISYLLSPPSYLKSSPQKVPKKVLDKPPPLWYSI